jgi:hypothetical protein
VRAAASGRAFGELHLQAQRRQRGAQFVGGVGDELALRLERALEAGEQLVQRRTSGTTSVGTRFSGRGSRATGCAC